MSESRTFPCVVFSLCILVLAWPWVAVGQEAANNKMEEASKDKQSSEPSWKEKIDTLERMTREHAQSMGKRAWTGAMDEQDEIEAHKYLREQFEEIEKKLAEIESSGPISKRMQELIDELKTAAILKTKYLQTLQANARDSRTIEAMIQKSSEHENQLLEKMYRGAEIEAHLVELRKRGALVLEELKQRESELSKVNNDLREATFKEDLLKQFIHDVHSRQNEIAILAFNALANGQKEYVRVAALNLLADMIESISDNDSSSTAILFRKLSKFENDESDRVRAEIDLLLGKLRAKMKDTPAAIPNADSKNNDPFADHPTENQENNSDDPFGEPATKGGDEQRDPVKSKNGGGNR